jgi:hypothetical protein
MDVASPELETSQVKKHACHSLNLRGKRGNFNHIKLGGHSYCDVIWK